MRIETEFDRLGNNRCRFALQSVVEQHCSHREQCGNESTAGHMLSTTDRPVQEAHYGLQAVREDQVFTVE